MSTTPEEFLGQILTDGQWVDYARGTETASRRWQADDPKNRRVVDWIDKAKVIVAPTPEPRFYTYDDLHKAITPIEGSDDLGAYWYAFGRLDQGHAPVAGQLHAENNPSPTSTAWLFGSMWMQLQREYRDPEHERTYSPGMEPAWENFVQSAGHSLDRQR